MGSVISTGIVFGLSEKVHYNVLSSLVTHSFLGIKTYKDHAVRRIGTLALSLKRLLSCSHCFFMSVNLIFYYF